jgi:site-specific DNA-adenine methylase
MSEGQKKFERLLIDAINEGLKKVFGEDTAKSVVFYIDPNIALADADNYARSVQKLFGPGSTVVLVAILDSLQTKTGMAKVDVNKFGESITHIRQNFSKKDQDPT